MCAFVAQKCPKTKSNTSLHLDLKCLNNQKVSPKSKLYFIFIFLTDLEVFHLKLKKQSVTLQQGSFKDANKQNFNHLFLVIMLKLSVEFSKET